MVIDQMSEANRTLYKYWGKMVKCVQDVDAIIINGDICEGNQKKEDGLYTITTDLNAQIAAAIMMLKQLPDVPTYYTRGTAYHIENNRPMDECIAKELGGIYGPELIVKECGIKFHCQHYLSSSLSVWVYEPTALARDLVLLSLQNDKYGKVDVAIRSHRHRFCAVSFADSMGICTPSWKVKSVYSVERGILSLPNIGWIIIETDEKEIRIDRTGIAHLIKPCAVVGRDAA